VRRFPTMPSPAIAQLQLTRYARSVRFKPATLADSARIGHLTDERQHRLDVCWDRVEERSIDFRSPIGLTASFQFQATPLGAGGGAAASVPFSSTATKFCGKNPPRYGGKSFGLRPPSGRSYAPPGGKSNAVSSQCSATLRGQPSTPASGT